MNTDTSSTRTPHCFPGLPLLLAIIAGAAIALLSNKRVAVAINKAAGEVAECIQDIGACIDAYERCASITFGDEPPHT